MFVASIICLIIGLLLLALAVVIFFKLDVKEALLFVTHKRSGKPVSSSSIRPRQQRKKKFGKTASGKIITGSTSEKFIDSKLENQPEPISSKKPIRGNDKTTTFIKEQNDEAQKQVEESESPTTMLEEESEKPTSMLQEDSENPTSILEEDSERPTSMLQEDSENPTTMLEQDSESPTSILDDDSEKPTTMLKEQSEQPTDVLTQEDAVSTSDNSDEFYFKTIKNIIEIHTNEKIQ